MISPSIFSSKSNRLRIRFTFFFIILAATPVVILGIASLSLIDRFHREDIANLELQLIDQKIEEIEKFFIDTAGILELRVGFSEKAEVDPSHQQFILDGFFEENKSFEEVSFVNLVGQETSKKMRTEKATELLSVAHTSEFKEAVQGRNMIGNVSLTSLGPFLSLAAPVRNRNGETIQVLLARVNISSIVQSIAHARLGKKGYLLLVDGGGMLIAQGSSQDVRQGSDFSEIERVRRVLTGEVFDARSPRDRYESILGAVKVVGAGKKIPDIEWVLLAEWPAKDADTLARNVRDQVLLITFMSILAVLFMAPFLIKRLVAPIRELQRGAIEIEKGNFDKRVQIRTNDELEELGDAFNKMAQGLKRLEELRNEFVFIAAHELRGPVTAIRWAISGIFSQSIEVSSKAFQETLFLIKQASERLNQLVNDILEIAQSESGRLQIKVHPCELTATIQQSIAETKPLADQKKIAISHEKPRDMPKVWADSIRLQEIVTNLITNAIKYNREGGEVRIFHEMESQDVVTHVRDSGFGIPFKDQQRLFEKFFRTERQEIKQIQGTGLGLFIAKELVEKMQGKIWFQSQEGKGSTFSFRLPIVKA